MSRLGLAAMGAAAAFATMSGSSLAQNNATTAAPAPALTAADAARIAKGRDVFGNYGCSACHTLADAGATGHVGPSFDENANLSQAFVVDRVTNGQGQMPAFGGQMSDDEIDAVAAYIIATAKKP